MRKYLRRCSYYKGENPNVRIPETIGGKTEVSLRYMRFDIDTVTSVYIAAGVVEIVEGAFYLNDEIKSVNVPNEKTIMSMLLTIATI